MGVVRGAVVDLSQACVTDSGDQSSGSPKSEDVVIIHGVTDDGRGFKVLRAREGEIEAGAVKPLEQGKPIHGEVVRLKPREECPLVCDVQVDLARPDSAATAPTKGPAQVASEAYRRNWDAIWSGRKNGALPN